MLRYFRAFMNAVITSMRKAFCIAAWRLIKIKQYPRVLALGRCGFTSNRECNPSMSGNYAILATQGKNYHEDGFWELLQTLVELKINPFIIISGRIPQEHIDELATLAHRIAVRPNFGRDMAAYKEATLYLHDQGITPKRLLYLNDSLIYLPGDGLKEMVGKLLTTDSDVMGATQSFERYHHIGSFIFSLSGKAFAHPGVRKFWEKYRQYNLRPHCIFKGELKLSRWLRKKGFYLDVLYNAGIAAGKVNTLDYETLIKQFPLTRQGTRTAFINFLAGISELNCPIELVRQCAVDYMFSSATQSQIHTYFGIFHKFLNLPIIKKDIVYRSLYNEKDLALILSDMSDERKASIFKLLNSRGLESELSGFVMFVKRVLMLE